MAADPRAVRAAALNVFRTEQGAQAFLSMRNAHLGGVPEELVAQGRGDEVVAYLERLAQEAPPARGSFWQVVGQQWARGWGRRK